MQPIVFFFIDGINIPYVKLYNNNTVDQIKHDVTNFSVYF